jgi:dephospho-CoA kinase
MLKVGLTGGIGSGKTAVSNLFHDLGIHIIDTDLIAHELVNNDRSVLKKIVAAFGTGIIDQHGKVERKKLAQLIFNNKENKQLLENILHPEIRDEVNRQLLNFSSYTSPPQYIIIVIPLLLETDFRGFVDRILVVISDEKLRIERVTQRDNRSVDEIQSIIACQVSDEKRLSAADDIIENNKDISALKSSVQQLHDEYMRLSRECR